VLLCKTRLIVRMSAQFDAVLIDAALPDPADATNIIAPPPDLLSDEALAALRRCLRSAHTLWH
jgi:hypothetical protein